MALINCPECSKEISDKVKACPFCGFPFDYPARNQITPGYTGLNIYSILNKVPKKKFLISLFLILFILVGSVIFVSKIQLFFISNKFNSQLEAKLNEGLGDKENNTIKVSGMFGEQILHIEKEDNFGDFIDLADDDIQKITFNNIVNNLYKLVCLSNFVERGNFLLSFFEERDSTQLEFFKKASVISPKCIIETPNATFEYYQDEKGIYIFKINGEILEVE